MRFRYGSKYFRLAFCVASFFLIATAALLTIINRHNDASAVAVNPDIWNLEIGYYDSTVNNGNTFLTDNTWHRTADERSTQERRRITFQINYSADSIDRDYAADQLVITLPLPIQLGNIANEGSLWHSFQTNDLGTTYHRYTLATINSEIAASTNTSTDYDWRYRCETGSSSGPRPNCYFYNNKAIQAGTSFRGSIQIVYDVITQPTSTAAPLFKTEFEESISFDVTATLNNTVESNHAKMTYTQDATASFEKEKYTLGINAKKLDSFDGLGSNASDYTWVHYYYYGVAYGRNQRAYAQKYEDPYDGPGSVPDDNYQYAQSFSLIPLRQWEWTDELSPGVVVYDANKNAMSRNADGEFIITQSPANNKDGCKYTPSYSSYAYSPETCYEVYVGYPKDTYNDELGSSTVIANGFSKGTYFQSETEETVATATKSVNLSEFSIEYHGNDIGFTKIVSPSKVMGGESTYVVNYDQFKTSSGGTIPFILDTKAININSKPYTIIVGDDLVYSENADDGTIERLGEDEYSFTSIMGDYYPVVTANGETFDCAAHDDFKIYYRLKGENEYRLYNFKNSDYARPCGNVREGNSINHIHWDLPENTVAWRAVLPNLTQGIMSWRLMPQVTIKSQNLPERGTIHNFGYTEAIDSSGNILNTPSLENYGAGITRDLVAAYDQATYNRYMQRAFASFNYVPFELGPVIHSQATGVSHPAPSYSAASDAFEGYAHLNIYARDYTLNKELNWEVIQAHLQPEDWTTKAEAFFLLARGEEVLSSAEEIAQSQTTCTMNDGYYYQWAIPDSHPFRTQSECNNYINSHTTVVVTKNWHNSGRTHIKITIDFSDKPIATLNKSITLGAFRVRTRIPYDVYEANEALNPAVTYEYGITGYTIQDESYRNDPENNHNAYPTPDNGREGFYTKPDYLGTPALPTDINDNGDTTEELNVQSQPFRILGAISVEQSIRETLWTDQTNSYTTDDSYVSAGGEYKHRLSLRTGASRATNVVVYDSLETAYEDNEHWQGRFNGVDTSYADGQTDQNGKTIKVKTYYSTSATAGTLEADSSNWHEYIEGTTDKSTVKSIAFEYLTTENTPAVIAASSYIYTTINMLAPTDEESNIFAYNKFTSYWTDINSVSNAVEGSQTLTSNTTRAQIDNKITIHVVKKWVDFNNKYQTRPNSVTPILRRGSELIDNTSSIDIAQGASTLDYNNLHEYYKDDYNVSLDPISNYDTVTSFNPDTLTYTITSTLKTTGITVQTIWNDNNDAYNLRPDSVDYNLKQGNTTDSTKAMDIAGNQNSLQFDTIPTHLFDNFTVAQEDLSNYSTRLEVSDDSHTYTFINTLNATFDVTINHEWIDESNTRNLRPTSVTYTLNKSDVANDTATATPTAWTTGFQSLPLLERDTYTVPDVTVAHYSTTKSCVDGANNSLVCTFTSTLEDNLDINIIHNWVDANNAYNTRPTNVTYQLQKSSVDDQTTTSSANWTANFTNLHAPDQAQYSVVTPTVADYDTTVEVSADGKTYTFTSTLTKTYDITINHVWVDENNTRGLRPTSTSYNLMDGNAAEDSSTATPTAWTTSFQSLPLLKRTDYSVQNEAIDHYSTTKSCVDGENNSLVCTFTSTLEDNLDINIIHNWIDADNAYNTRPASVTYQLQKDNVNDQTATSNANWTAGFTNLHMPDASLYHVVTPTIADYDTTVEVSADGKTYTFTSTLAKTFNVVINHEWVDNNNERNLRPTSTSYNLLNGNTTENTTTATPTAWTTNFNDLPLLNRSSYAVDNNPVAHYGTTKSCVDGENNSIVCTFTSTLEDDLDIHIVHNWVDADNTYHTRPSSVTYQLKKGNTNDQTTTSSANWTADFTNLHTPDQAQYSVVTPTVADYDTTVEVSADGKTYTFTSTLAKTFNVVINHVWNDENNTRNLRPTSVTYTLNKSDVANDTTTATPTTWTTSFQNLPLLDRTAYAIPDVTVTHYSTTKSCADGANNSLVCTFTSDLQDNLDIHVRHIWIDNDNADGFRPTSVDYTLKNGETVVTTQSATPTAWTTDFVNLYMPDKAHYSVPTPNISHYDTDVEFDESTMTYTFTSTLSDNLVIHVIQEWEDENNIRNLRPSSVSYTLKKTGGDDTTQSINVTNNESATDFANLQLIDKPKFSIPTPNIDHYETTVSFNESTMTYTFHSVLLDNLDIKVVQIWDDQDNSFGLRPTDVNYTLQKSGSDVTAQAVNSDNSWTTTFKNLHMPDRTTYAVPQVAIDGYNTVVTYDPDTNTYTFTSTLITVPINVKHIWDDDDNSLDARPDEVNSELTHGDNTEATHPVDTDQNEDEFIIAYIPPSLVDEYLATILPIDYYDTDVAHDPDTNTYTFTSTLTPAEINVRNIWIDDNNARGIRPASLDFNLDYDGDTEDTYTLETNQNSDEFTFDDLIEFKLRNYNVALANEVAEYTTDVAYDPDTNTYTFTHTIIAIPEAVNTPNTDADNPLLMVILTTSVSLLGAGVFAATKRRH